MDECNFEIADRATYCVIDQGCASVCCVVLCREIRSAEMMYALDQISVTANDLQKLNATPTEVCCVQSLWNFLSLNVGGICTVCLFSCFGVCVATYFCCQKYVKRFL